jgi:hypothetical protein
VKGPVIGQEGKGLGAGDFAEGFFEGISWDGGVQVAEGIMEAADEEGIQEGFALGCSFIWGDVGTENGGVAKRVKPREGSYFDFRFC